MSEIATVGHELKKNMYQAHEAAFGGSCGEYFTSLSAVSFDVPGFLFSVGDLVTLQKDAWR